MQILVQVADLTYAEDPKADQLLPKAGDVRMFVDGSNQFAAHIHANRSLRVVTVDLTLDQVHAWLQSQVATGSGCDIVRFRDRAIDLAQLQDGMSYSQLRAITTLKDMPAPLVS